MFKRFHRDVPEVHPAPSHGTSQTETCRTCGWFDSSHELRQGLQVREHASLAELSGCLPLADWLQWHAAVWQPDRTEAAAPRLPGG